MCSHTMSDLLALPDEHDRMKARGFVERAGMVICGGLPAAEMPRHAQTKDFRDAEQRQLISWQDPPAWGTAGQKAEPPGRGNFLIKLGGRPGIPFRVTLTPTERGSTTPASSGTSTAAAASSRHGAGAAVSNRAHRHATGSPRSRRCSPARSGSSSCRGQRRRRRAARRRLDHWRHPPPVDPLSLALELADGKTGWPPAATAIAGDRAAACSLLAVSCVVIRSMARRARRIHADRAAPMMGAAATCTRYHARTRARPPSASASTRKVCRSRGRWADGQPLYASWEDMQCDIGGPRRGKTIARAIPTLLSAPGAVFATSNKPDIDAATRLRPRAARAGVELRPRTAHRRRAQLVVEPAQLRDL